MKAGKKFKNYLYAILIICNILLPFATLLKIKAIQYALFPLITFLLILIIIIKLFKK